MKIKRLIVGQLATNCYLVFDEKTRESLIIDPGDDGDYIIRRISDLRLQPKMILATHGHFDHILAVTELKLAYNIPFLIHQKDLFLIKTAPQSAKHWLGINVDPVILPDRFIEEKDSVSMGQEELTVLETPGHTPGSLCLMGLGILFSGDTLFAQGVGRTDFSYSSKEDLQKSLKKIFKLADNVIVYPGHGEETIIKEAKPRHSGYP